MTNQELQQEPGHFLAQCNGTCSDGWEIELVLETPINGTVGLIVMTHLTESQANHVADLLNLQKNGPTLRS